MSTNTTATELRKLYRTTVFIGLAMMASLVVYYIVVAVIESRNEQFSGYAPVPQNVFTILRYVLLGMTAVEFFIIRVLNTAMLSAKIPNASAAAPISLLMSASVVTFALCESVAVYGLVLFLIQGSTTDFYLFLMISLLFFTVYFPKYSKWEEWVRERERQKGMRRQK